MITGSLQIKKDYYYAVLNLKENGKRKPKWLATGLAVKGNKRKAEAMLQQFIQEYSQKEKERLCGDADILFADYLQSWLKAIQPTVATATFTSYANMTDARIDKWFRERGIRLCDVTSSQIQSFYQTILDDGCTANTVIHYHAVLHRALKNAVKKDLIARNPADQVDKPKKNVYTADHYSREEMLTLFDAVQGDPLELPVVLAAYYGLRRSEALGLRWSAVDFEHRTLAINHKVIEVKENGVFVPKAEDVLKTKSSVRTLPLIPAVEEKLREQKERQETFRRLFKKAYCTDFLNYVCTDELGRLLRPNFVTDHFRWLLQKYGLKVIRFHDLRHTCASLLLDSGAPMKQIQLWLGHSNFSTTADIYAHLDYRAQMDSARAIEGVFGPSEAQERPFLEERP